MNAMTSVTFRNLEISKIIQLALRGNLQGIEWGGDIHVPSGNLHVARVVGEATRAAGLEVLSYGSYYFLCESDAPEAAFDPVLRSAEALGAPIIRLWAGRRSPQQADESYLQRAQQELSLLANVAETRGIRLSLEFHRGTLTETIQSALALLRGVSGKLVQTYWQPNPEKTKEENLQGLASLQPFISNVHVFHWDEKDARLPLRDGIENWLAYMKILRPSAYLLEFVQFDSIAQFLEDCRTLAALNPALCSENIVSKR